MRILLSILLFCVTAHGQVILKNAKLQNVKLEQAPASGGGGGLYMITTISGGSPRSNFSGEVGDEFVANTSSTIVKLGRPFLSGNTGTHTITVKDSGCSTIATVSVTMTDPQTTVGGIPYVFASVSGSLVSGQTYSITTTETSGGDTWIDSDSNITVATDFTVNHAAFGTCPYSNGGSGVKSFASPNIQYTIP